jgi:hypothetical protein
MALRPEAGALSPANRFPLRLKTIYDGAGAIRAMKL